MTEMTTNAMRGAVAALRNGDSVAARSRLDEVLDANPRHGGALILLARVKRIDGELDEAEQLLRRAREAVGEHPQLVAEQGYLALARSDSAAAVKHFEHLTALLPNLADAHFNLGHAYRDAGRVDASIACFERALELGIGAPWEAHTELGSALTVNRRETEARAQFERALAMRPGYPRALYGLGVVCAAFGEFDRAERYYRDALEGDPGFVEIYQRLVATRKFRSATDADIVAMRRQLDDARHSTYSREKLHFALGKALDDCAEYEEAFEHYSQANDLKSRRVVPYDERRETLRADAIIETFDAPLIAAHAAAGNASDRPIVIVGMPRSGTSLIEQILSCHSAVEAGGELNFFEQTVRTALVPYPDAVRDLNPATAAAIAADYLGKLDEFFPNGRVTDKYPANYIHLGLIAMLFPEATLIHCARNPFDTCLSVFFQDFTGANHYANRLQDIGHYFRQYQRLLQHWQAVLGERLLTIDYEQLVAEPEAQIRALLAHAGLPFEQACLHPDSREGAVATMSLWQVRQPIYTSSSARWHHYRTHLDELAAALALPIPD